MQHVFWLVQDHIAGRPGPDQAPWRLAELRGHGIRAVLSVNDARQCSPGDFAAEGIVYACIPLSANAPPLPGDVEHCLEALPRAYDFAATQL